MLVDLKKVFPRWDPNNNYLWHALVYVKKIFYNVEANEPVNSVAGDL